MNQAFLIVSGKKRKVKNKKVKKPAKFQQRYKPAFPKKIKTVQHNRIITILNTIETHYHEKKCSVRKIPFIERKFNDCTCWWSDDYKKDFFHTKKFGINRK